MKIAKTAKKSVKNLDHTIWPFYWLDERQESTIAPESVVFFGGDFYNISGIDRDEFIKKNNQCLDYIRKNFPGHQLYYKPHPAETTEKQHLNLERFNLVEENILSDLFVWKNRKNIKCTFSIFSSSSITAHALGVNSYNFLKFCLPTFHRLPRLVNTLYFQEMSDSCFIENLEQKPLENKVTSYGDQKLSNDLSRIFADQRGKIWLIITDTRFFVTAIALASLFKKIKPEKKIGLIVSKHHRWDIVRLDEFKKYFDEIIIFPRIFYSLKPKRLWEAIKTSFRIKRFKIGSEDIMVSFGYCEFVENCFISYHQDKFKIAFMPYLAQQAYFKTDTLLSFGEERFSFTKASIFYNKILEPLLGIHRTIYLESGDGKVGFNLMRFQDSIEKVYDLIYFVHDTLDRSRWVKL